MKSFFKSNFPIFTIALIILIIAITNYSPGTFITGGDNLHPELDLGINIKRSVFAVWQEYQGLGLLGGMGHASDLLRQLFLFPFSLIFSTSEIRWMWTFLTLFIGSTGAYYLFLNLLKRLRDENLLKNQIIALIGGLFYLLNLSTVQSYFTPFEVFTAHFAFLPWLMLLTINFFTKPNRKNILLLFIGLFIATPAAYVPTLFVVYMLAASIFGIILVRNIRNFIFIYSKFIAITFMSNAFWLLPFLYFTFTNAGTNVNAKINQMATDSIYLHNREFGHIWDVILLKGFWFNNVEPNINGDYKYMLFAWKDHIDNPAITLLGFAIFLVIVLGIIGFIKKKSRIGAAFVALFIFIFIMLATATPPFSFINDFIRNHIPLFGQIFRFPFTKFSILASLMYSFLFCYGIDYLIRTRGKAKLNAYFVGFAVSIIVLVIYTLPIFKGQLFYEREKITIPSEYFKTFEYFKSQDPNTRIANFPQFTFWGWNFYDWGYSGSGFLWYGIKQPILDRAFDVWGANNENYYWEINQALYAKDPVLFESVLNKYDINWILLDKNVTNPSSPKSLFIPELEELVKEIPGITKEKDFGDIEIYKINLKNKQNKFVSSTSTLSEVNPYAWSNYDQAYLQNGDYISKNENPSAFYPFRTIFTGRAQEDIEFIISEKNNLLEFKSHLPESSSAVNLEIPSPITSTRTIPAKIIGKREGNIISINFVLQTPKIILKTGTKENTLWNQEIEETMIQIPALDEQGKIDINGVSIFQIPYISDGEEKLIGSTTLTISDKNNVVISDSENNALYTLLIPGENIKDLFAQDKSSVRIPKIKKDTSLIVQIPKTIDQYSGYKIDPQEKIKNKEVKIVNCDNFRKNYFSYFIKDEQEKNLLELSSRDASPCLTFYVPTLDHDQAYLIRVKNENIKNRGLHFWVLNEDQKTAVVDTYFEKKQGKTISTMVLPPLEKFGKAYSLHFDNISIGKIDTVNRLGTITINPIPYYFITNMYIEKENAKPVEFAKTSLNVEHPNESLYLVSTQANKPFAFTLSQSYSPYWKAYAVNNFKIFNRAFPFIFGKEVKNHVKVNNWKNGWIVDESSIINGQSSIIVVYLPQYLQYVGFALTTGTLIGLIYAYLKHRKKLAQKLT